MGKRLSVKHRGKLNPELTTDIPQNGIITVGNDPSATIELGNNSIPPEQFVIICEPEQSILMCRVDGTEINGHKTTQGSIHNLQNGDRIIVKEYEFTFETDKAPLSIEKSEDSNVKTIVNGENKSEKTLTDILQSLRSDEKFYLQIQTESEDKEKLFIDDEEAYLGINEENEVVLSADETKIEYPSAQIRKDWSGVVVYPFPTGKIWLGDSLLDEPYHLKNEDFLYLQNPVTLKPNFENKIIFHEPTTLLALDSILPKELPPPISLEEQLNQIDEAEVNKSEPVFDSQISKQIKSIKKLYFGYFTIFEIIIMIIGTLITSVLIFLILEFY